MGTGVVYIYISFIFAVIGAVLLCFSVAVAQTDTPVVAEGHTGTVELVGNSMPVSYAPNQVIVVYGDTPVQPADEASVQTVTESVGVEQVLRDAGLATTQVRHVGESGVVLVSFDGEADIPSLVSEISRAPGVTHVQPNYLYQTQTLPSPDPLIGHSANWPFSFLEIEEAYAYMPPANYHTNPAPILGIVDNNTKTSHPELTGNLWRSRECVDDTGARISSAGCVRGGLGIAKRVVDGSLERTITTDPEPGYGKHGTLMAGAALSAFNNGKGGAGIARRTKLMALAAPLSRVVPYRVEKVSTLDGIHMINVARQNGADVLSISWQVFYPHSRSPVRLDCSTSTIPSGLIRSGFDELLYNALRDFPGVVTIAAGNSGRNIGTDTHWAVPTDYAKTMVDANGNHCWSGLTNILPIGGIDRNGAVFTSTNYGTHVALLAPAIGILLPSYKVGYSLRKQGRSFGEGDSVSVDATSWTIGSDSVEGRYVSPIPSSESGVSASVESSYTIGPIDLSFIDPTLGEGALLAVRHACPSVYEQLTYTYSGDGETWKDPVSFHDPTRYSYTYSEVTKPQFLTDTFYFRFNWSGSSETGLVKESCKIFDDNFVFFNGSLRSDLSHAEELLRGYYEVSSGTSISSAIAAGVVALLLEVKHDLTVTEIREILAAGASTLSASTHTIRGRAVPSDTVATNGSIVNVLGALRELKRRYPTAWPPTVPDAPTLVAADDTGAPDLLTKKTTLSFTGVGAQDASITLRAAKMLRGFRYVVVTTVTSDGTYTATVDLTGAVIEGQATTLPSDAVDGEWEITVTQHEAGRTDAPITSEPLTVTVDATVPVLETAVVNGTEITLTYSEPLDADQKPSAAAFTVTVDGVVSTISSVEIPGTALAPSHRVVLTLDRTVPADVPVILTYTNPHTNPGFDAAVDHSGRITDGAYNDAVNFLEHVVLNQTPSPTPDAPTDVTDATNSGSTDDLVTNHTEIAVQGTALSGATVIVQATRNLGTPYTVESRTVLDPGVVAYEVSLDLTSAVDERSVGILDELFDGAWDVTVKQIVGGGAASLASPPLRVVLDTILPIATVLPAHAGSAADGYVNRGEVDTVPENANPIWTGMEATDENGVPTVEHAIVTTDIETCDATLSYTTDDISTVTPTTMAEGVLYLCARAMDVAGNTMYSTPLKVVRDSTAPAFVATSVQPPNATDPQLSVGIHHNQTREEQVRVAVIGPDDCANLHVTNVLTGFGTTSYVLQFSGSRRTYSGCSLTLTDQSGNVAPSTLILSPFSIIRARSSGRRSSGGGGGGYRAPSVPVLGGSQNEEPDPPLNEESDPPSHEVVAKIPEPVEAIAEVQTEVVVPPPLPALPPQLPVPQRDLRVGVQHEDVLLLQRFLNQKGFPVALSGLGSSGEETNYFGPATRGALIAFQQAHGVVPSTGHYGPATRLAIQQLRQAEEDRHRRISRLRARILEVQEQLRALLQQRASTGG